LEELIKQTPSWRAGLALSLEISLACAWLLASPATASGHCFKYAQANVAVIGKVVERTDWGPPNYGEDPAHDSRERHNYVLLEQPLCVDGDFDDPAERDVRTMELAWDPDKEPFPAAVGRRVRLNGFLFHAISGHHHTRVLLMVRSVLILGPIRNSK
jgi:hypothetical protein